MLCYMIDVLYYMIDVWCYMIDMLCYLIQISYFFLSRNWYIAVLLYHGAFSCSSTAFLRDTRAVHEKFMLYDWHVCYFIQTSIFFSQKLIYNNSFIPWCIFVQQHSFLERDTWAVREKLVAKTYLNTQIIIFSDSSAILRRTFCTQYPFKS